MAPVTVQSIGGDGCDECDGLIELNNGKKKKNLSKKKTRTFFFVATEKELLVLPSHPSQKKPQTNMRQEVEAILEQLQLPSQSITSITDGGFSVLSGKSLSCSTVKELDFLGTGELVLLSKKLV